MQEYKVTVDRLGNITWTQNGVKHRVDGPAIEYANGTKAWYNRGVCHRVGGPAIEYADGTKYWYQNNNIHRLDGHAIEYTNGVKAWYIEGKRLSEEEFLVRTRPVKELTVEEISKLLGYEVKVVRG